MGEGWSDFFTLATTAKSTDIASKRRTIGNYILRQDETGRGVRNFPYSVDMEVSPYTYEDVWTASVPHGVGAAWAAYLWDIYWGFIDQYGFDEDPFKGNGGNNKAIQLVMDAMKLTPCNPGFLDGRDALLKADEILYGGAHQCLIWEMSSRRGLGHLADQGQANINADGKASFIDYPPCIQSLKVVKHATDVVDPGGIIDYTILIDDQLANGLSIVPGSNSMNYETSGNTVSFKVPQIPSGDTILITYQAIVPADLFSVQQIYDDMETGDASWDFINREGTGIWELDNALSNSGSFAWSVPNTAEENDQILEYNKSIAVTGDLPVLRFYQFLAVQHGFDGGILEISNDGGNGWQPVPESMFLRNGYTGPLRYDALSIPNLRGFYGLTEQFIPTYVDLSDYLGQNIHIRFRFGSNNFVGNLGWIIDDFEIMDLKRFKTEICVRADGIASSCTETTNEGTFIESDLSTPVTEVDNSYSLQVFPNPSTHELIINNDQLIHPFQQLEVFNNQGVKILDQRIEDAQLPIKISTQDWSAGFYWITLRGKGGIVTEKIIKN
jgi:hypothetical protein